MSKEIYISSTPHETRLAIVEKEELSEIYYERENEYTLAGSIYNGRVTRVLPGMQSAFVDVGLERDAFLYITDFLEEQGEDTSEFEGGEVRREGRPEARERSSDVRRGERGGDRSRSGRGREPEPREVTPPAYGAAEPSLGDADLGREAPEEGSETGEEAGDGSRRWRGRRGRRRGGRNGEAPALGQGTEESIVIEGESAGLAAEETEGEPMERIFGSAAASTPDAQRDDRPGNARDSRDRESRDRGGRDRGTRGRDRDRGGDRTRGPERGAAPPESGAVDMQAGAEPLILPGESLSRYKGTQESDPQSATTASGTSKLKPSYLTARPSTEIDLSAAGWDGGMTLPGESLSRRRGPSEAAAAAPVQAQDEPSSRSEAIESADDTGATRRKERDRRRGRSGRPESETAPETLPGNLSPADKEEPTPTSFSSGAVLHEDLHPMAAVQPGVSSEHDVEATALPLGENSSASADTSAVDGPFEPVTDTVAPAGPSPALLQAVDAMHAGLQLESVHAGEEFHEETQEYEPGEDAAASYRVDPAGPSEFRQSNVADDDDVSEGDPAVQEDYAGSEHQFTTIADSGEMLSELPGEIAAAVPTEDPTNPIEHQTAVLTEQASKMLGEVEAAHPAQTGDDQASAQAFAPGHGYLEEELMDDEDVDALNVAASFGDDTEEETFEAGAEIGSLVQDRALDAMTLGNGSLLDDDDDDEDFDIDEEEMEEDELNGTGELAASDLTDIEEDELVDGEAANFDDDGEKPAAASMGEFPEFTQERPVRDARRESADDIGGEGKRDPRRGSSRPGERDRGGRDRSDRNDRGDRAGRDRRGMAGSRSGGRPGSRHSMQTTDLPAISDLLKPGQEVLVQIAKEPIAKKGARITSHIALPGRFLVFMPTVNHVGVSRKIESDSERRRLKEILLSEKGEAAGGFIVRTAASGASEEELRSDLRFLLNLWADIKSRSDTSKSPALIYHDLNLVERVLRDQVSENFSAIWCDTETEYERVLRFLQRFEPSLMRRVKLYTKDTPLFDQFGISEEINKALRSKVWLKSGGSIVINQTEALVAIDINTGKYVGKTARLEDTIVKTNLDAIPEIVRQVRLRDLGGIIVIDFIDMDDRKNRQKVLIALEEELKKDRAPSKVLQFNDFGLVAITRKRVKQSLERTLSTTCGICAGTGMVKSPVTVCNEIYIELRKMHKQLDKGDVMLRVNPEVVKQLKSNNAKWLQEMEEIAGKTILVKSDPGLHPEQFDIH